MMTLPAKNTEIDQHTGVMFFNANEYRAGSLERRYAHAHNEIAYNEHMRLLPYDLDADTVYNAVINGKNGEGWVRRVMLESTIEEKRKLAKMLIEVINNTNHPMRNKALMAITHIEVDGLPIASDIYGDDSMNAPTSVNIAKAIAFANGGDIKRKAEHIETEEELAKRGL